MGLPARHYGRGLDDVRRALGGLPRLQGRYEVGEVAVRGRWLIALVIVALVGTASYAIGLPYPVVYVVRGIARHFAYGGQR